MGGAGKRADEGLGVEGKSAFDFDHENECERSMWYPMLKIIDLDQIVLWHFTILASTKNDFKKFSIGLVKNRPLELKRPKKTDPVILMYRKYLRKEAL